MNKGHLLFTYQAYFCISNECQYGLFECKKCQILVVSGNLANYLFHLDQSGNNKCMKFAENIKRLAVR